MAHVRDRCRDEGLGHSVLDRMVDRLARRNERVLRIYGGGRQALPA